MRSISTLICLVLFTASPVSYLRYERPVHLSGSGVQQYFVADEAVWKHARPDLGDLRLYAGATEVPYALITERDSLQRERTVVPVLQQSTVAGKTQFLIDMSSLAEYNHLDLDLTTRNFVAHARVEGENAPQSRTWAVLGDSILYDLSSDGLGSNHMLRLPRTRYKFLRVTIDGPVKPRDVRGASSETTDEQIAHWRDVAVPSKREEQGEETVITFNVADHTPVERAAFTVDSRQPNFWRKVEIQNIARDTIAAGEIKRIHMVRAGRKIDSEEEAVQLIGGAQTPSQTTIKVIVHNGDDPPLRITDVRLQQLERRVYFDTPGRGQLALYYGDEKLEPPVYEYARLFQFDKAATLASLAPEVSNDAYKGRPDDRPWSERHPVVLWIAIVGAVVVLGGIALRSLRLTAT
ncbi:MAG TPA: DUF3999 family protein [Chthoniobacterales bacterium]|nr:DUF3999 family protein [Chthoniobacterales bacterium]